MRVFVHGLVSWLWVTLGCVAWVWAYVGQEDPAYLSDFQYYWKLYWTYGELFQRDLSTWWSDLRSSVLGSEYNPLFTVALLPFNVAWGRSRLAYIEAMALMYMLPAMWVTWHVIRKWIQRDRRTDSKYLDLALVCVVACTTSFWIPTLRGYPDVWGLVPLALAIGWLPAVDFTRSQRLSTLVGLALCIYAPFLIRKWYVFAIVSVVLAHGLVSGWKLIRTLAGGRDWGRWLLNHAIIGALVIGCVFTIQRQMALNALSFHYTDAYVAFQRTWVEHIEDFVARHGVLVPLLGLSGWWIAFKRKRVETSTFAFLWLSLALTLILFTRVQGLGIHHHLPVGLLLCLTAGLSIGVWVQELGPTTTAARATLLAVCALAAFNFLNVFLPSWQMPSAHLLQTRSFPPLTLENPAAYRRLADIIETRVAPGQRVSIFASNAVLSQTMMENFLSDEGVRKIAPMAEVDEYEGFNLRPLYSDYLVVPSQPQVIDPAHQRVVSIPSTMVAQGHTIGAAYRVVDSVDVKPGLKFLVFQKTRAFHAVEVREFLSEFADLPRPSGQAYTPMQLALLGVQVQVADNGRPSPRIDMVGGGEWALTIPSRAKLTLSMGFWPTEASEPIVAGLNAAKYEGEQVFSVQRPSDQAEPCRGVAPRVQISLDGHLLLSKVFDQSVVDYFKVQSADIPRLKIHVQGGDDPTCDRILIDHRTD